MPSMSADFCPYANKKERSQKRWASCFFFWCHMSSCREGFAQPSLRWDGVGSLQLELNNQILASSAECA